MKIAIKADRKTFKTRAALVAPKKNEPTEASQQKAQKIVGYQQEGHYFVAIVKNKK